MNTEVMARGADKVSAAVVALHKRYEEGELTLAQFKALARAELVRAQARGIALASLGVAADLTRLRKSVVPATGLSLPESAESSASALVQSTIDGEPYKLDPLAAIAVMGSAHYLEAVQEATGRALESHGARYWVRVLNEGACELCEILAEDTLPASATMYHHKGCGCSQQPVDEKE